MFCDLADSTKLSGQLDPEDLRDVIRAFQSTNADVIERYDGYIAQHLGDGLMVYFGWPQAHEDDDAHENGVEIVLDYRSEATVIDELVCRKMLLEGRTLAGGPGEVQGGSQGLHAPGASAKVLEFPATHIEGLAVMTLENSLTFEDGAMKLSAGYRPRLDREAVESMTVKKIEF